MRGPIAHTLHKVWKSVDPSISDGHPRSPHISAFMAGKVQGH